MTVSQKFLDCWKLVGLNEGGYTVDNGGPTNFGITQATARKWGYEGDMKNLPPSTAQEIAYSEYWLPYLCDNMPTPVAFQVFDTAYNGGYPIKWLQTVLNTPATGTDLTAQLSTVNVWMVVAKFNALRLNYLAGLKQPQYANGRMNRISRNLSSGGDLP